MTAQKSKRAGENTQIDFSTQHWKQRICEAIYAPSLAVCFALKCCQEKLGKTSRKCRKRDIAESITYAVRQRRSQSRMLQSRADFARTPELGIRPTPTLGAHREIQKGMAPARRRRPEGKGETRTGSGDLHEKHPRRPRDGGERGGIATCSRDLSLALRLFRLPSRAVALCLCLSLEYFSVRRRRKKTLQISRFWSRMFQRGEGNGREECGGKVTLRRPRCPEWPNQLWPPPAKKLLTHKNCNDGGTARS